MAKSRKYSKKRYEEILKAQMSVQNMEDRRVYVEHTEIEKADKNIKKPELQLPINDIKRELVRNAVFAVISFIVLGVLYKTQFGYQALSGMLNF